LLIAARVLIILRIVRTLLKSFLGPVRFVPVICASTPLPENIGTGSITKAPFLIFNL
jgi:hypothetical protein